MFEQLWNKIIEVVKKSFLYFFLLFCGSFEVLVFLFRQKVFGNKLPGYSTVAPDLLYRGGQPSMKGVKELVKRGVKTIINLRVDDGDCGMMRLLPQGTLSMRHIPFYPDQPTEGLVIEFLSVMTNLKNHPVYIHCYHGVDRTGFMCAIYRIVIQGWKKEKAIDEMIEKGLHWWQHNLIEFIRGLNITKIKRGLEKYCMETRNS